MSLQSNMRSARSSSPSASGTKCLGKGTKRHVRGASNAIPEAMVNETDHKRVEGASQELQENGGEAAEAVRCGETARPVEDLRSLHHCGTLVHGGNINELGSL